MPTYSFTTVNDPGTNDDVATGIDDSGQIVGYYADTTGIDHGFLDTNGTYTPVAVPGATDTSANGINSSGEIVGNYDNGTSTVSGFSDTDGTIATIDVAGATQTFARGVNDSGEIVGYYYDASSSTNSQGFSDINGTITSIDVTGATSTAAFGVNSSGEIVGYYVDANGNRHGFSDINGTITTIDVPGASSTFATGVNSSGQIVGFYLDASSNTHGFLDSNGTITTIDAPGSFPETQAEGINDAGQIVGTAVSGNDNVGFVATPVCFASGTLIRTARGDMAIEALAVGNIVVTATGAYRPIKWLGHRNVDCRNHPRPHEVMPIRIAAHAFGENKPAFDLHVSPAHAVCVDTLGEVLIPAAALVNGTTIVQVEVETVTYWHVELDSHDVLLAENLPAESYLEMGNRSFFAEAETVALHAGPDAPAATHADFCRPYVDCGPQLDIVRSRLAARAEALAEKRRNVSAAA